MCLVHTDIFYSAASQAVDVGLIVVVVPEMPSLRPEPSVESSTLYLDALLCVQSTGIFFVQPLSGSGMSCQQSRTATKICVEQHHFTIFDVSQLVRVAESEIEGRLQSLYFGHYTVYNRPCKTS